MEGSDENQNEEVSHLGKESRSEGGRKEKKPGNLTRFEKN